MRRAWPPPPRTTPRTSLNSATGSACNVAFARSATARQMNSDGDSPRILAACSKRCSNSGFNRTLHTGASYNARIELVLKRYYGVVCRFQTRWAWLMIPALLFSQSRCEMCVVITTDVAVGWRIAETRCGRVPKRSRVALGSQFAAASAAGAARLPAQPATGAGDTGPAI